MKDLSASQTDYHIHTAYCHHATGEMKAYVQRAIQLGFSEIGFSDHAPVRDPYDPEHRMNWDQFSIYVDTIQALGESYPQIQIRLGIEADVYHGFESSLKEDFHLAKELLQKAGYTTCFRFRSVLLAYRV